MFKNFKTERLVENLQGFVETKVDLVKLELKEDLRKSTSKILVVLVLALFLFLALLLGSIGLAFWLNELFSSAFIGFFCLALTYIGLFIIILLLNKAGLFEKVVDDWISQH